MHVVAMCGSLRAGSYNWLLLNNAVRLAPPGMTIEVDESPRALPFYDQDAEPDLPAVVHAFKERVRAADALLFVTPEYNHSIPGVLKNAIDWLSRPTVGSPLAGKPVAVFGCGSGTFGAVRMQVAFREILFSVGARQLPKFEVIVFRAAERFDADGRLTDAVTIEAVRHALDLLQRTSRHL
jgi:chromate reductase